MKQPFSPSSCLVLAAVLTLSSCRISGGKVDFSIAHDYVSTPQNDEVYLESGARTPTFDTMTAAPATGSVAAAAPAAAPARTAEKPDIYVVKKGDSLSSIATKRHTTVDALMKANKMKKSNLAIGQKLIIPAKEKKGGLLSVFRSDSPEPAVAPAPQPPAPAPAPQAEPQEKQGNFFTRLWRKDSAQEPAAPQQPERKAAESTPKQGNFFTRLWRKDDARSAAATQPATPQRSTTAPVTKPAAKPAAAQPEQKSSWWSKVTGKNKNTRATVHTVKQGDSIYRIANRYKVTPQAIIKANKLNSNSAARLNIGQKLTIPAAR